jgi:hypothetical protein
MWDLCNSAAVSAASRPKFHGEILRPRTGTVPKLAGEDACATRIPAFLGITNAVLKLKASAFDA